MLTKVISHCWTWSVLSRPLRIKLRCISSTASDTVAGKRSPTSSTIDEDVTKIRNIGFIAHIDAGKTTTTERMLYYSGLNPVMGEVHQGDTVTDYLAQERERGITITSASTTFPWKRHKINLLDTPGHVDFIIEVERCLNVLDSAIVILDSSNGVEAQTTTVWQQANRYNLPRIVYANKMDKANSDLDLCLTSLAKLNCKPILIQLPIYDGPGKKFTGLVDIITLDEYQWEMNALHTDGTEFVVNKLTSDHSLWNQTLQAREKLIGLLTESDETLGEAVLSCDDISQIAGPVIINSLRKAVIRNQLVPVLVGSSYKNIGVQPLMDAVIKYFPSPVEKANPVAKYYKGNFCASAFKVVHHKMLGSLTFLRLYSGNLTSPCKVYNINRNVTEKITKIYAPFADQFKEITSTKFGNIVAVAGLVSSITGDTLTSSVDVAEQAKRNYAEDNSLPIEKCSPVLTGITIPDPVFFCTIEAPSLSKQNDLDKALANLTREDPTLTVTQDAASGQTILSGMGELHLEVIQDRIRQEYNVDAQLGPLRISYRETLLEPVEEFLSVNKQFGGANNYVTIKLLLRPSGDYERKVKLKVVITKENDLGKIRPEKLKAIENGIEMGLAFGPLMSFPVVGVDVNLLEFRCSNATHTSFISSITSEAIAKGLKKASMGLMEPIMRMKIAVPDRYFGPVISDLTNRRGELINESYRHGYRVIEARTPLSELISYSTFLRTITSGTAILAMHLDCFHKMSQSHQEITLAKLRVL